jgi:hypothetical protein
MSKDTDQSKQSLIHDVMRRFFKVVFYILLIILSVNFGKFLGYVIFKFIMWLGVLPYLEKFFGWFVW